MSEFPQSRGSYLEGPILSSFNESRRLDYPRILDDVQQSEEVLSEHGARQLAFDKMIADIALLVLIHPLLSRLTSLE